MRRPFLCGLCLNNNNAGGRRGNKRCSMPSKPLRPCSHIGCKQVTAERFCKEHQSQYRQQQDKYRGSAHERGYGRRWQRARLIHLAEHPLCKMCADDGVIKAAVVVDHITPHKGNDTLFWDSVTNWQSLCKQHHDKKTATEDGGFGR